MAATRDRALEAAVRLVGEQGIRALTHARVDEEAGLPKGSTSNWFRTRDALVAGVLVWIAEQERAELTVAMATVRTAAQAIDALTQLLDEATGPQAVRTRARYALFLETSAARHAQPSMRAQRSLFEEWTRELMTTLGAPDVEAAARTVLAVSAGLIVNRLTVAPDIPLRPTLEPVVRSVLSAAKEAGPAQRTT